MRRFVLIVVAAACLRANPAGAQDVYANALLQYLTGDADAAISTFRGLDQAEIVAGLVAFNTTRSRLVLTAAAALHTEAAFRGRLDGTINVFHLQAATAIVQFGEGGSLKTNTSLTIRPRQADPVSPEFRRLWYCGVISILEDVARLDLANRYLAHALTLFPKNQEIQMLAGVAEEMRSSPRTSGVDEGERRKALENAEKHYRAVLVSQPDRLEARLRLGHVLQQRKQLEDARLLLTPLASSDDARIAYLASLFLGGVEDAARRPEAALALYDQAAARIPSSQTARLAASELRHRAGDRQAAARAVPAATGADNSFDPWWTYIFGEYWRADLLLDALRKARRP